MLESSRNLGRRKVFTINRLNVLYRFVRQSPLVDKIFHYLPLYPLGFTWSAISAQSLFDIDRVRSHGFVAGKSDQLLTAIDVNKSAKATRSLSTVSIESKLLESTQKRRNVSNV